MQLQLKQLQSALTFRSTEKKSGERRLYFDHAIPSGPTCPVFFWLSLFSEIGWVLFDLTSTPQSRHAVFAQTHTNAQTSCFGAIPVCKQSSERSIRIHLGSSTSFGIGQGIFEKMNSLFVCERDLILVLPWRITGYLERHSQAHFWFMPAAFGSTIGRVCFGL